MSESYIFRLIKTAKSLNWRCEEKEDTVILTHISLPDPLIRIVAPYDNIVGEVRKFASGFNRDEYFGVRYQQEMEADAVLPNAQALVNEARSAEDAVRYLANALECVPPDSTAKKLGLRVGMSIFVTPEELTKINAHTKEGMDLLRDKFFSAAFTLTGETYSMDNFGNHGMDEWEHPYISYQF